MMKIKSIYKFVAFFSLCVFATTMTGCKDSALDEPGNVGAEEDPNLVTLVLDVKVPSASSTRSTTESDGSSSDLTEDGKVNENTINEADIYFYYELSPEEIEEENQKITDWTAGSEYGFNSVVTRNGNKLKYVHKFTAERKRLGTVDGNYTLETTITTADLENFKNLAGKDKVYVFVIANAAGNNNFMVDDGQRSNYEKDLRYAYITNGAFAGLDDFGDDGRGKVVPMTNKSLYQIDLSEFEVEEEADTDAILEALVSFLNGKVMNVNDYNSLKGKLELERSVARVDFKPNQGKDSNGESLQRNLYQVGRIPNLYAKMTHLQGFNLKNGDTNAFRQAAQGTSESYTCAEGYDPYQKREDIFLLGDERGPAVTDEEGNTVDSYNWIADWDWNKKLNGEGLGGLNKPSQETGQPEYMIQGTAHSIAVDELNERIIRDEEGYIPWRYMQENTVPTIEMMKKKYCTGVAFYMTLTDKDGIPLTEDDFIEQEDYDDLEDKSEAEGKVIGSFNESEYTGYYLLKVGNQECYVKEETDSNGGKRYVVTYYYFFRHNLPLPHTLGDVQPMQFAVVRNNIYKISVTSLNALPIPFDPEDPAEPQTYYMSLEIKVLAWAKRDITVSW